MLSLILTFIILIISFDLLNQQSLFEYTQNIKVIFGQYLNMITDDSEVNLLMQTKKMIKIHKDCSTKWKYSINL